MTDVASDSAGETRIRFYALALVLMAVAWSFSLSSFQHAKEIVLVVAVMPALLLAARDGAPLAAGLRLFVPLALFLFLQVLRLAWPGPFTLEIYTLQEVARTALIVLFVLAGWDLVARQATRQRVFSAVVFGGVLCGGLALLQKAGVIAFLFPTFVHYDQDMYSVFGNQGGLGAFCALGLALLLDLPRPRFRTRTLHTLAALVLLAAVLLSGARSAWLALFLMLSLRIALSHARRRAGLITCGAAGLAAMTVLLVPAIRDKWLGSGIGEEARLWFWQGALAMFADRPFFGQGLGAYPLASPLFQGQALASEWSTGFYNELHTFHAHNDLLEVFVETGVVGVVLLAAQLFVVLRQRPVSVSPLIVYGVVALFNAAWFNLPLAVVTLLCVLPSASPGRHPVSPGLLTGTLAAATVAIVFYAGSVLVPSYLRGQATARHIAGLPSAEAYARCRAWPFPDYQAAEFAAMAHLEAGAWQAAAEALDHARQGLDTGRVHLLTARAAQALGEREAARTHYRACLARWPWNEEARDGAGIP